MTNPTNSTWPELEGYLAPMEHQECGDECSKKYYEKENLQDFRDEISKELERARSEERETAVKAANAAYFDGKKIGELSRRELYEPMDVRYKDEYIQEGYKAGLKKALELIGNASSTYKFDPKYNAVENIKKEIEK